MGIGVFIMEIRKLFILLQGVANRVLNSAFNIFFIQFLSVMCKAYTTFVEIYVCISVKKTPCYTTFDRVIL